MYSINCVCSNELTNQLTFLSFSERAGKSTTVPGKLIPLREPKVPPFCTTMERMKRISKDV